MTKNLAGRGEGLAGLGEARAALEFVDRLYSTKGGVINPEHYGLIANSNECGQMINAVRDAVKRLAALEAAAPAGTALPPDWLECKEFYDLMQCYRHTPIVKQDLVVENYEEVKHWLRKQVAALATPSPQAPAGDRTFSPTELTHLRMATASGSPECICEIERLGNFGHYKRWRDKNCLVHGEKAKEGK